MEEVRPQTRLLGFLAFIAAAAYIPLDSLWVEGQALAFLELARFPLCVMGLSWGILGYVRNLSTRAYYTWVMATGVPGVYIFPTMVWLSNGDAVNYGYIAQTQVSVFLTLLLRLPMYFVLPNTLLMLAVLLLIVSQFPLPTADYVVSMGGVLTVTLLCLAVAYRMDFDSRKAYVLAEDHKRLLERERASERDRIEWLHNLSRYLKHEFRNSMLGISTSLDRIEQSKDAEAFPRYVGRARASLEFMRALLASTTDAASISAAARARPPPHVRPLRIS